MNYLNSCLFDEVSISYDSTVFMQSKLDTIKSCLFELSLLERENDLSKEYKIVEKMLEDLRRDIKIFCVELIKETDLNDVF